MCEVQKFWVADVAARDSRDLQFHQYVNEIFIMTIDAY